MIKLKQLFSMALPLVAAMLVSCSGDDDKQTVKPIRADVFADFESDNKAIKADAQDVTITIKWSNTEWKIEKGEGDIISEITPDHGGDMYDNKTLQTQVTLKCTANTGESKRTQKLVLKSDKLDKTLTLTQDPSFESVDVEISMAEKFQHVEGFGGMYNPFIWCGGNLVSAAEMEKFYNPSELGYTMLRLMIYPNSADWSKDVEGAKIAQKHGAIIFACPWDCTDALADKTSDGKKHLKKENYGKYADHIVAYIDYMKQQGVKIFAVSMQNEPDMDFTAWTPTEVRDFMRQHGATIRATGVKLMSPETCGMRKDYNDLIINDAKAFEQTDILAGHLYQGFAHPETGAWEKGIFDHVMGLRQRLGSKQWWMTEHLFNDGEKEANESAWVFRTWDYNLKNLAWEMHWCMEGNCSAYVYWYLRRFYGLMGDNDKRSPVAEGEIAKNGYIVSHYAKYASGRDRIKASSADDRIYPTAYVNAAGTELTMVMLNMSDSDLTIKVPVEGASDAQAVVTSETLNMQSAAASAQGGVVSVSAPAMSIVSVKVALK